MHQPLFTHVWLLISLMVFACSGPQKKTADPNNDSTAQKTAIDTIQKSTKTIPKVKFEIKQLTQVKNQDARVGTDSESLVELYIDNTKVDAYKEWGDGDLFEEGTQANLNSEMSEKIYTIPVIEQDMIEVKMTMIFEGEEKDQWTKTYTKNDSGNWTLTNCKGECD